MSAYFIAGTDTGVGKTLIATALILHLVATGQRVAAMKPIAAGCVQTEEGWLNDDVAQLRQAANVALPVVDMRLGCLNHALLTLEAIQHRGIRLAGWIANRVDPTMQAFDENLASLRERISAPLWGVVPPLRAKEVPIPGEWFIPF